MTRSVAGRLRSPTEAPGVGETSEEVARIGGVIIEQILSGELRSPLEYDQDHDEWVLVLSGSAVLEVGVERVEVSAGDWLFLSAHQRHRLLETEAGTSWLAVQSKY